MKRMFFIFGCGLAAALFASLYADESGGEYLHYRLGMKYKTDKQYDKAVDEFRKVLAEYPDNYNVYMHIAEIRIAQDRPQLAVANLKQALAYNPGWGKAHKLLANAYEKDKLFKKAITEYQLFQQSCDPAEHDSVQQVIDRLVAKVGTGALLGGQDAGDEMAEALPVRPEKQPGLKPARPADPRAAGAFDAAVQAYGRHDYDTSLKLLKTVIRIEPGFSGSFYYGGLIRFEKGESNLAKINFSKSANYVEPEYAGLLCRARLAAVDKNYTEAVSLLSRYIKLTVSDIGRKEAKSLLARYQPLAAAARKSRAATDSSAKKAAAEAAAEPSGMEVRIDSLLSMVTVDTLSDAGRKLLGGIREFQLGNFDKSIREFKRVLVAYPAGAVAAQCLYNCGICYFKLGLLREAENQFQQVLERYPRNELAAQSLFLKALAYSERRETNVAEGLFREFLQAYPSHSWRGKAWERLGDAYVDLEQTKKAIDAYSQALSSSACADQVSAFFKMGNGYVKIGNAARGFGCFDSAIARGERCNVYVRVPDSYYSIADEKYRQKDYQGAMAYYTRATRKYPAFQETPWGIFQMGNIHKNLREYQKAIDVYKDLMQRFPDDYWARQAKWKLDDAVWEHEYQTTLH